MFLKLCKHELDHPPFHPDFMTYKGWENYLVYLERYGKDPEIVSLLDMVEFGFITLEDAQQQFKKSVEQRKRLDSIFGTLGMIIFFVWLCFAINVYSIYPSFEILVLGPITGTAGIVLSALTLRRSLKTPRAN